MPAPPNSESISISSGIVCIEDINKTIKTITLIASERNAFAQLCSLKPVCSPQQVLIAFEHARSAISNGTAFAKSLEIEFLLRLAGTKKIEHALKILGLRNGEQEVLLVISAENEKALNETAKEIKKATKFEENEELLKTNLRRNFSEIKKIYGIGNSELEALSDLGKEKALESAAIERIAMVALED